jgi:nickel transport protein
MMQSLKQILLVPLFVLMMLATAIAHEVGLSANIRAQTSNGQTTYTPDDLPADAQVTAIEIIGTYSSGEPMSGAQINIFAPGNPSTPWQTGTLDEQGRYTFTPDLAQRGRWTVRIEQTGHSGFMNLVI